MLNFSPDHLDRHPDIESYGAAKARIFENQTADDWAVINADDPAVLELAGRGAPGSGCSPDGRRSSGARRSRTAGLSIAARTGRRHPCGWCRSTRSTCSVRTW